MQTPPEYMNIRPKRAENSLRVRRPDEPWVDWLRDLIAHTEWELMLSNPEWQQVYGVTCPQGYRATLAAQERYLREELHRHFARLPWDHTAVVQAARVLHELHRAGAPDLLAGLRARWVEAGQDALVAALDEGNIAWEIRDLVEFLSGQRHGG